MLHAIRGRSQSMRVHFPNPRPRQLTRAPALLKPSRCLSKANSRGNMPHRAAPSTGREADSAQPSHKPNMLTPFAMRSSKTMVWSSVWEGDMKLHGVAIKGFSMLSPKAPALELLISTPILI